MTSKSTEYEQYDRNGSAIRCANGSDAKPCYRRPELTLRCDETADSPGRWLGTICRPCAERLIKQGKAYRSATNAYRVIVK